MRLDKYFLLTLQYIGQLGSEASTVVLPKKVQAEKVQVALYQSILKDLLDGAEKACF